ncbi:hypothetical protein [Anaerotignum sp. MB30-C6]|uniref:hypothetical protein n=1 Tax=Anaerotignum sp. MB30-C6 TaxID=3070814 RepID=UPI0027DDE220|nr:hypothetical protein [Anaerotignum sp. MB30-C6]WMI81392.1 hypothetical protein RBQ60_01275 [Anaerotignum sp. MB30-C6]
MIFANTQAVADIATKVEGADTVLFSMRGISNIDVSCAQTLKELIVVYQSDASNRLKRIFGEDNFYWSVERVLLTNRPKTKAAA